MGGQAEKISPGKWGLSRISPERNREIKYKNMNRMRLKLFIGWHLLSRLYVEHTSSLHSPSAGRLWQLLLHPLKHCILRSESTTTGCLGCKPEPDLGIFQDFRRAAGWGVLEEGMPPPREALWLSSFSVINSSCFWQNFPSQQVQLVTIYWI